MFRKLMTVIRNALTKFLLAVLLFVFKPNLDLYKLLELPDELI